MAPAGARLKQAGQNCDHASFGLGVAKVGRLHEQFQAKTAYRRIQRLSQAVVKCEDLIMVFDFL